MTKESKKQKKAEPEKKHQVSPFSPDELLHYKQLLLEKRAEIIGNVSSMESEALKKSRLDAAGDLSSMPIHMADIGTDNYEQEFALGLLDSERKILHEINDALARIEDDAFGICEGTGEPIPKPRLEAAPWARFSVAYQSLIEKGLVEEPDSESDQDASKKKKKRKKRHDEEEEDEAEIEEIEEEEAEAESEEESEEEDEDEELESGQHHEGLNALEEDEHEDTEEEKYY